MNDKLLLRQKVNILTPHVEFLQFIHPHFKCVDKIDEFDDIYTDGIIYKGVLHDDTVSRIEQYTRNWIIVNNHRFDIDLSTNENLIKYLLPINYIQIKKNNDLLSECNKIKYESLLEKIKLCLIDNRPLSFNDDNDNSIYCLFQSILMTPQKLAEYYFNIVDRNNISVITSSILTFLTKVQTQNTSGSSIYYARLINQSYKRYGKYIKSGIYMFVRSKANKEIALYNLLSYLNRAR